MTILQAIILGIVEGITEFLPVSSTGHLILTQAALGIAQSDFVKTFTIVIQLGAILAVVALYWKSFFNLELLKRIIVAFIPTGIIGYALYHFLKSYLLGNDAVVLVSLFLGGIFLIGFEEWHGERMDAIELSQLSYRNAALIGLCQSVAIIPGVSRSAATIVGGLVLGVKRAAIVEFSFLLAVPTMLAASGLDLLKSGVSLTGSDWGLLATGFVVSFILALAAVRWLLSYVRGHSFTGFGIYRIALAIIFAAWLYI